VKTILFLISTILIALLQTTWLAEFMIIVLLIIGLSIYVDVIAVTVFALVSGLVLDALGIHEIGISSALLYLLIAGALEVLRLSFRTFSDHPVWLYIIAVIFCAALIPILNGYPVTGRTIVYLIISIFIHLLLSLAMLPAFIKAGGAYQDYLREKGIL
jgi:hypothetical protein